MEGVPLLVGPELCAELGLKLSDGTSLGDAEGIPLGTALGREEGLELGMDEGVKDGSSVLRTYLVGTRLGSVSSSNSTDDEKSMALSTGLAV